MTPSGVEDLALGLATRISRNENMAPLIDVVQLSVQPECLQFPTGEVCAMRYTATLLGHDDDGPYRLSMEWAAVNGEHVGLVRTNKDKRVTQDDYRR
jgi:hypothetical protein